MKTVEISNSVSGIKSLSTLELISNRIRNNVRNLAQDTLEEICVKLHLPTNIIEKSQELREKVQNSVNGRAWGWETIAAASIYITARIENNPRTIREMINFCSSNVTKNSFRRCFLFIEKHFTDSIRLHSPLDYITRWCGNLGMTGEMR